MPTICMKRGNGKNLLPRRLSLQKRCLLSRSDFSIFRVRPSVVNEAKLGVAMSAAEVIFVTLLILGVYRVIYYQGGVFWPGIDYVTIQSRCSFKVALALVRAHLCLEWRIG